MKSFKIHPDGPPGRARTARTDRQMDRKKLKSKYGMSIEQPAAVVTDRKLSPSVMKLRAFILENKHHGIELVIHDGRPALRFRPGLIKGTPERWDACLAAEVLLFDAAPDLVKLIDEQKIELNYRAPDPAEPVQLQEQLFQGEK